MAKTENPLLGTGASGAIGKSLVFGAWKGVRYARRYVVPANPRTSAQTLTRDTFAFLVALWNKFPAELRAPWREYARGKPLTDRNALVKHNLPNLRGETSLAGLSLSPGAGGGYAPGQLLAIGGSGGVTASLGAPSLPEGWQIVRAVFALMPDQEPIGSPVGEISVATDSTAPYEVSFSGLEAGSYYIGAFFQYRRPDGKAAFSPGLATIVTVS